MKIHFSDLYFEKLCDESDISSFSCSDEVIDSFLLNDAKEFQKDRIATTYLFYLNEIFVSFVSLANGCIDAEYVEPRAGKQGFLPQKYPALLIAQMGTHKDYQKMGIGENMLKFSFAVALQVCEIVGCRVVRVDASKRKSHVIEFYKKYGLFEQFGRTDGETAYLLRDLTKICDSDGINADIRAFI
ncbi:MAG: GNAT family N-acetyltransferase [Methanoregulaceae archaeon]|nr:GNAT family N-acetyltransferase [Methanoregulaceae archaeon]HPQ45662.1 GNAT family N-acetyltransferase [Syntrophales bacterium]